MAVQGYLNKSLTKLLFGSNASLNVSSESLGEGSIKMVYQSEAVQRLDTCVGQVMSLNFYRKVTITISISKVSNSYLIYSDLIESGKSVIPGYCEFTNDVNRKIIIKDLSIEKGEDHGSGETASVDFILSGTQDCNQGAFEV